MEVVLALFFVFSLPLSPLVTTFLLRFLCSIDVCKGYWTTAEEQFPHGETENSTIQGGCLASMVQLR